MEFRILGPLEVVDEDGSVELGSAKQRALLAVLLLDANRHVSSDRLIDALWGAEPPQTAVKALHVYVSGLRKALGKQRIETSAAGYLLRTDGDEVDAARCEQLCSEGRFTEALALWRGAPLADFAYHQFAQSEIARLEELRLACFEGRIDHDLASGRHAEIVGELEATVAQHPLRERLRSQLMLALYRCGRQAEALEAYHETRRLLVDELGIEPGAELQEMHRAILRQDGSLSARPAPQPADVAPRASLPVAANRLIGRRSDLHAITDLLLGEPRLVTVTGAGGSGKTRLALEVATSLAERNGREVTFVSLAPVQQPELLSTTIMTALGVKESATETPALTLRHSLQERSILLILDNFEHLLAAAPLLAELLAYCPRLKLLVTSRASLHLSGEHEYPLEPLPLEQAIVLFGERARAVRPEFVGEEPVLAAICTRLDCLPLALELAAARSRLLSPPELLARLERRLELLTGGARDLASRQQTLRSTIAWSYELLELEEQELFRRLAVFSGGCTLDAAEQVSRASLDRLQSLVDKNLLRRRETAGTGRFWMLETIREYALEQLEHAGVAEETRRAHSDYFVALGRELVAELDHGRREALDALEHELDNFRAAFTWACDADPESAVRLTAALSSSWYSRDQLVEGLRWLETVVAQPHLPSRDLAVVVAELARLSFFIGDPESAAGRLDQALELAEALELPDVLSETLTTKGLLLETDGKHDEALALLRRSLAVAREHDLGRPLLRALINTAHLMHAEDRLLEARSVDIEGLELSNRLDSHVGRQRCLGHLLEAHVLLGDWEAALAVATETEERSLPGRIGDSLTGGLPWLRVQRGEVEEARQALERHVELADADEVQARASYALAQAVVLRAEGRPRDALLATERALEARAAFGPRHPIVKLAFVEAVEAALALDDDTRAHQLLAGLEEMPDPDRTPFVEAHRVRFRALLAARDGDTDAAGRGLAEAAAQFAGLSMPFYAALAQLEQGELLVAAGRAAAAEPLFAEAQETFQRLEARPWVARVCAVRVSAAAVE
jgi:predicted ATPase/DNA-binding SARP family transcriptional activator